MIRPNYLYGLSMLVVFYKVYTTVMLYVSLMVIGVRSFVY
nr:MAG TPA: hypothetical protein [Caudoviricetes sp.]